MNYARWKNLGNKLKDNTVSKQEVDEMHAAVTKWSNDILAGLSFDSLIGPTDEHPEVALGLAAALKDIRKTANLSHEEMGKIAVLVGLGMISAGNMMDKSVSQN